MKLGKWQIFGTFVLGLAFLPQLSLAGIPSGPLQITVTGPTNHIWDASSIGELQNLDFGISSESVDIAFASPFVQTGAGKLTGAGTTQLEVDSSIFAGTINAAYKANGSITSVGGVARLKFSSTAKGLAPINGQARSLAGTFAASATIDSVQQIAFGSYTSTGTASGYGSVRETGPLQITWNDVVTSMGNGDWTLEMVVTNDAVKKIGGTAIVTLSSGAEFGFVIKGSYKSTTDTSLLVLIADAESKGSSLKVTLTSSTITSIQGKVSGQAVKWKP